MRQAMDRIDAEAAIATALDLDVTPLPYAPSARCPHRGARVEARNTDLHLEKVHPDA
jgi:hypothetical protein